MKRRVLWLLAACLAAPAVAAEPGADTALTATQIVEKNVSARGGLEAWRKIQSMVWLGHIDTASAPGGKLPFVLQMERPNKTRFAIDPQGQASTRVFDGSQGWKLRRAGGGPPEVQPYTAEELKFARDGQGIDGPLIDYAAKGISVALEGLEEVEGRSAYRLKIGLPSGTSHHVWIDAESFLDLKSDREFHGRTGLAGTVSMYYRNYRLVDGVQMPLTIETGGAASRATDKMVIDRISLNPPLDPRTFAKPDSPLQHKKVTVDTRTALPDGAYAPGAAAVPGIVLPRSAVASGGGAR